MSVTANLDQSPATPEEIWKILRETAAIAKQRAEEDRQRAEEERRRAEEERRRIEEDRQRAEEDRQRVKEDRQRVKEERQRVKEERQRIKEDKEYWKEYKQRMAELDKKMGWLNNRFGEVVEHLVAPGIMDKFNEMGLELRRVSENSKLKDAKTRQTITEIDIMLEGPGAVIAVSVKSKANDDDISEHVRQMEKLRLHADEQNDKRPYLGAIASAVTSDSLRARILKAGFYAVEQAGDTMQINVPKDFKPRKW